MAVTKFRWQVIVLWGAAWAVACGSAPELPRVSEPQPTLNADDHAVIRATLDYLRPFRHDSIRRGWLPQTPPKIDARFLVIDATAAACVGNRDAAPISGDLGADVVLVSATDDCARLFFVDDAVNRGLGHTLDGFVVSAVVA